jgi:hypothetical protein
MNQKCKLDFEILSRAQARLLPNLVGLKSRGFYLAGGTALALHLGHRSSVDFDFYSSEPFEPELLLSEINRRVTETTQIQVKENTLILECDKVQVSAFYYPYRMLKPLEDSGDILLASVEDIAAMKVIAIIQRGRRRDFIDIFYLIDKLGLKKLLALAERKYPDFNLYLALQALTYFEDAERENEARAIRTRVPWKTVKNSITAEVKRLKGRL